MGLQFVVVIFVVTCANMTAAKRISLHQEGWPKRESISLDRKMLYIPH
jgi:hypothetical protein